VYPKWKIRRICITIYQTVLSSISFTFSGKNAKNDGKVKAFRYEYITCSGIQDILLTRLKQLESKAFPTMQE
ncbi:hypothetical protein, partial [Bacteroides thetaiotaomicron]|uniref:hypothetical protein n=1 Tax=Bacteroides thetaiotaomicron TaxID=818 RepID=UPI001F2FE8B4